MELKSAPERTAQCKILMFCVYPFLSVSRYQKVMGLQKDCLSWRQGPSGIQIFGDESTGRLRVKMFE